MELHDLVYYLALPLGRGKHVSSAPMHSKFLGQDFLLVVAANSLLSHPGKKLSCLTNQCRLNYYASFITTLDIWKVRDTTYGVFQLCKCCKHLAPTDHHANTPFHLLDSRIHPCLHPCNPNLQIRNLFHFHSCFLFPFHLYSRVRSQKRSACLHQS